MSSAEPILKNNDRLTIIQTIYHQQHMKDPSAFGGRYNFLLTEKAQPYDRYLDLTNDWTPIDVGWIEDKVGFVIIENRAGRDLEKQLTPEEQAFYDAQIIQFRYKDVELPICIGRGRLLPFEVTHVEGLEFRIKPGENPSSAPIRLSVITK